MAGLAALAPMLSVVGTVVSAFGQIAAGNAAKQQADFEAQELRQQEMETNAAASRQAADRIRTGKLVQERAQAVAAASGGSTTDPTTVNIEQNIAGQSEYNAATALWSGAADAAGLENRARSAEAEGSNAQRAGYLGALSSVVGGFGTMAQKYGEPSPTTPSASTSAAYGYSDPFAYGADINPAGGLRGGGYAAGYG